jgi:hypothetical protein
MLKVILRKKKRNNNNDNKNYNNNYNNYYNNYRLQQVADYQPGNHLKEGTQIFILLSVWLKV